MLRHIRTTIRLEDNLLREAKSLAARRGRTLTSLIEDCLREQLSRAQTPVAGAPVALPTFRGGGGLRPGVDLDDNARTLELLEEELPADGRR